MYVAACAAVALAGIIQIALVIQMARHLHAEGISVLPATLPLMQLASAVLTLLLLQPLSAPARDITAAIAAALLAVATVLDPLLLRRIVSAQNAETELARERLLGEQLAIQQQHLVSVTATLEQARSIRAGMFHKVGGIDDLLARGEDGQALLQLEQMVGSLGPARVRLCDNPVADALLAMKMERCDELGIAHSVNAVVPADLPLSGTEACALFANIVDNAIHACEIVPEGRRTLSLDAHAAGGFYVVRVKNSCARPDELRALERESEALRPDSGQVPAGSARSKHHQRTGNARGQGLSEHGWGARHPRAARAAPRRPPRDTPRRAGLPEWTDVHNDRPARPESLIPQQRVRRPLVLSWECSPRMTPRTHDTRGDGMVTADEQHKESDESTSLAGRRILVVDDDPEIASLLDEYLNGQGYAVTTAHTGREALERATCAPDLVILDVGLPDSDGFEVCRRLRETLSCPIVFLTARVEDADALTGFEVGGDDYVLKPFSLSVLGARIRAHLVREDRRRNRAQVRFAGDILIDYRARTLAVGGEPVALTKREFDIVALLSKSPGQVFERELIHERVCGWDSESDPSVITEHVRRLRNKMACAGPGADPIETIWDMGYRWRA